MDGLAIVPLIPGETVFLQAILYTDVPIFLAATGGCVSSASILKAAALHRQLSPARIAAWS